MLLTALVEHFMDFEIFAYVYICFKILLDLPFGFFFSQLIFGSTLFSLPIFFEFFRLLPVIDFLFYALVIGKDIFVCVLSLLRFALWPILKHPGECSVFMFYKNMLSLFDQVYGSLQCSFLIFFFFFWSGWSNDYWKWGRY